jgi:hypothetical protein
MLNLESPLRAASPQRAKEGHPVWGEIAPYFTPDEFSNPYEMDVGFLRWLLKVRKRAGVPMHPTSDARDPDGDVGADDSAHKKRPCRAIDGQVRDETIDGVLVPASECLARIYIAAVQEGCVRFGTYRSSKGLGDIYHLDAETHAENPSPRWWTKWA